MALMRKFSKNALPVTLAVVFLSSCGGSAKNDNTKKIKEAITGYLTTGVEKKDIPAIDSIGINSIDTLTQKNSLKIALDRNYNMLKSYNDIYESKQALIKADAALLGSMQQQKTFYEKHGEKYDDASLTAQETKTNTDITEQSANMQNVQKTKSAIDSITKLYTVADSVSFYEYYVGATVYIKNAPAEQGSYIISKDWKVRR